MPCIMAGNALLFPVHNMQMNKADEEFMNKVINVIQENISDENFNVSIYISF